MDPTPTDRQPMWWALTRTVTRALRVPAGFAAGAAAVLVLTPLGPGADRTAEADVPGPVVMLDGAQEATAARAQVLLQRHDCWRGEAPAAYRGRLPGHVVLTRLVEGREVTTYAGPRAVGEALDHVFTRPDPTIAVVHGFCR